MAPCSEARRMLSDFKKKTSASIAVSSIADPGTYAYVAGRPLPSMQVRPPVLRNDYALALHLK